MRTSHGVLGAGLLAALVLAEPLPAAAGDVNVIVSAHPKVRVIVGNIVPRHGLKAHPGVRVIAPRSRPFVFTPPPRPHTLRHPVGMPGIDNGFTLARPHPPSFAFRSTPPLGGTTVPKLVTPSRHGLQGLPAGSRFLLRRW
jgi:hypothetical protein